MGLAKVLCVFLLPYLFFFTICYSAQNSNFYWTDSNTWSSCSTTCDDGNETMGYICMTRDRYGLSNITNEEKCIENGVEKPNELKMRTCNLGRCDGWYFWRITGEWGICSQTCGHLGMQTREVQCHYLPKNGPSRIVSFAYCPQRNRPIMRQRCNRVDCPPVFKPKEWGQCPKPRVPCEVTKKSRRLDCGSLLSNGTTMPLKLPACFSNKKNKPPATWEQCYEYANSEECIKKRKRKPEIIEKTQTLIQMRKGADRIALQIGQEAYLLPWTKIQVSCPVNFYIQSEVKWSHGKDIFSYNGKNKDRIRVDRLGQLRIRKFLKEDTGEWRCIAGESESVLTLNMRSPAAGYADWTFRNSLWSEEMMNEDSKNPIQRKEIMQWVTQPWSTCSKSCGEEAFQIREVTCEKLDNNHYSVLKDDECIKEGLPKPSSRQVCHNLRPCPNWVLVKNPEEVCTDKCLDVGLAAINANLTCVAEGKIVDDSQCSIDVKPDISCKNVECKVAWRISSWSPCSISCANDGEKGFRSRYLQCVWEKSGEHAGGACYRQKLELPIVREECSPYMCKLKCLDLSPQCKGQRSLCGHSLYRSMCCATCTKMTVTTVPPSS